jgi:hypothetical protein
MGILLFIGLGRLWLILTAKLEALGSGAKTSARTAERKWNRGLGSHAHNDQKERE